MARSKGVTESRAARKGRELRQVRSNKGAKRAQLPVTIEVKFKEDDRAKS